MAKEEQTLFEVQKEKESAISAGDFEQAKELQARQQELEKDLEQIRKRFERRCKNKKLQVTEEEIAKTYPPGRKFRYSVSRKENRNVWQDWSRHSINALSARKKP